MSWFKNCPDLIAQKRNLPFNHTFYDEDYAKKFADEQRIGKQATSFPILAIFISCPGLFGFASFVA